MNYAANEIAAADASMSQSGADAAQSCTVKHTVYQPRAATLGSKMTRAAASVAVTAALFAGTVLGLTSGAGIDSGATVAVTAPVAVAAADAESSSAAVAGVAILLASR
jgi:hypothetical protein